MESFECELQKHDTLALANVHAKAWVSWAYAGIILLQQRHPAITNRPGEQEVLLQDQSVCHRLLVGRRREEIRHQEEVHTRTRSHENPSQQRYELSTRQSALPSTAWEWHHWLHKTKHREQFRKDCT